MKKIIYTLVTLLLLASVCIIVVVNSIVHVQLQHGAVLHVLPTYIKNKVDGAVIICPGGGYSYLEKWLNKDTYDSSFLNGKMHGKGLYKWLMEENIMEIMLII